MDGPAESPGIHKSKPSLKRSGDTAGGFSGLLFVSDLRRMLPSLGRDAIYGLLRSGEIPNRKVAGKLATTPAAVENWLSSITNGTTEHEAIDISEVDQWRRS
jgi:hypothetical protein